MLPNNDQAGADPTGELKASRRTRRSVATKLLQAATLAAALVPLSSVRADATTLGCTYFSGGGTTCSVGLHSGAVFDFGTYAAELFFDQVNGTMDVSITDVHQDFDTMMERLSAFPGYVPVKIDPATPSAPYIDFQVDAPDPGPSTWTSDGGRGPAPDSIGYELWLYWLADTNDEFPNPEVFHQTGETGGTFDTKITMPGTYFSEFEGDDVCVIFGCFDEFLVDPGVGGRDNMFSASFTLADASASAVPEPASLFLLGSGVSAMLYRRRRAQKRD